MLLRLPYLAVSSVFALIRLLLMSDVDKDIEILTLRHQLAVAQRQIDTPRVTPADRAFLAALLHRLPPVAPKLSGRGGGAVRSSRSRDAEARVTSLIRAHGDAPACSVLAPSNAVTGGTAPGGSPQASRPSSR